MQAIKYKMSTGTININKYAGKYGGLKIVVKQKEILWYKINSLQLFVSNQRK